MTADRPYRYETIAQELSAAIRQGAYAPGDRLPSVRQLSNRYSVSIGTALEAYRALEEAGLAAPRPRSGYYVLPPLVDSDSEPMPSLPSPEPTPVTGGRFALSLLNTARESDHLQMGVQAAPDTNLLPLKSLSRTLAGVARRYPNAVEFWAESAGYMELRDQISRQMRESGVYCSPEEIVITNGCQEALVLSLRAVASQGDIIAIETPIYYGILYAIEALGLRTLTIPTHPHDGLDLDELERAIAQHPIKACVFMPTCQNPLGSTMPDANKKRLVDILAKAKIPMIENDATGDLSFTRPRPRAARSFDESGNVLYCSSFSKVLSPGNRIGWVLGGRFRETIMMWKAIVNVGNSTIPQMALAEYLSKGGYGRVANRAARAYQRRINLMRQWVLDYFPEGTRVSNPSGSYFLWVEMPKEIDGIDLYRNALEKDISIAPGVIFSPTSAYTHHIRLSCGQMTDEASFREAVKTVGQLAHAMQG